MTEGPYRGHVPVPAPPEPTLAEKLRAKAEKFVPPPEPLFEQMVDEEWKEVLDRANSLAALGNRKCHNLVGSFTDEKTRKRLIKALAERARANGFGTEIVSHYLTLTW